MLFNSVEFLIFFPVVTALFFLLPHKFRWMLLLSASCFFYMFFKPEYILILFFTIIIDFYAGLLIEKEQNIQKKRNFLLMSLIANIGILAVFKYYNFINDNITGIAGLFGKHNPIPALKMLLPIGLSFHTFQAMSYTIEVHRGNQKAEKHFGIYALYVMFYPQLVAGPIERPQNILHQFHETKHFDYVNAVNGLKRIAFGLFKKIVVADRLAFYVDHVYNNIENANSISLSLASFFFAIQILCDFSGYSDIAIGAAEIMGYKLMTNFDRPFISKSLSEFWRRWHISLSTWFYDYLFIPLGSALGNWGNFAIAFSLIVTFFLSGLWHGAGWKFITYGCLHGLALVYEFYTKKWRKKLFAYLPKCLNHVISIMLTFSFVSYALIFFRAENFNQAIQFFKKLFACSFRINPQQFTAYEGYFTFLMQVFVLAMYLIMSSILKANFKMRYNLLFLIFITLIIIILGKNGSATFIYFQF